MCLCVPVGISAAEEEAVEQSTGRRSRAEGKPGPARASGSGYSVRLPEPPTAARLPALHPHQTRPADSPAPPGRAHTPGGGAGEEAGGDPSPRAPPKEH